MGWPLTSMVELKKMLNQDFFFFFPFLKDSKTIHFIDKYWSLNYLKLWIINLRVLNVKFLILSILSEHFIYYVYFFILFVLNLQLFLYINAKTNTSKKLCMRNNKWFDCWYMIWDRNNSNLIITCQLHFILRFFLR